MLYILGFNGDILWEYLMIILVESILSIFTQDNYHLSIDLNYSNTLQFLGIFK
jgi:hypothetical protein